MSKYRLLTGRTEILAAVYDEQNLPTALITDHPASGRSSSAPTCLHALREGPLESTEQMLNHFAAASEVDKNKEPEEIIARLYPFFEDYESQHHSCIGCSSNDSYGVGDGTHFIHDTESTARKLCEDCA